MCVRCPRHQDSLRSGAEWCRMVHHLYPLPNMSERIRLTISVAPDVHAVFSTLAQASGVSLGKCMGDWLADTAEGAQFVSMKMEEARKAPKTVMREFQAMARGLVEEVDSQVDAIRRKSLSDSRAARAEPRRAEGGQASPPSSNTGGKVPQVNPKKTGRKGS